MKKCSRCGEVKPLEEFTRDCTHTDGRRSECKACRPKYRVRRTPEENLALNLHYKYGITVADYDAMLTAQGGKCAICGTANPDTKRGWHVDHCHDTGKVRGLLCHYCNTGIGSLKDDPALLHAAAEYLTNNRKEN